ncbi:unnamed protein product [Rhizophagus irregularis]|nr:unnamed protein product [Rhizophagus irregularis]
MTQLRYYDTIKILQLLFFKSLNTAERFLEYKFEDTSWNIDSKVDRSFVRIEPTGTMLKPLTTGSSGFPLPLDSWFLSAFGIGYLDIGFHSALDTEYRVSASIFGCSCV